MPFTRRSGRLTKKYNTASPPVPRLANFNSRFVGFRTSDESQYQTHNLESPGVPQRQFNRPNPSSNNQKKNEEEAANYLFKNMSQPQMQAQAENVTESQPMIQVKDQIKVKTPSETESQSVPQAVPNPKAAPNLRPNPQFIPEFMEQMETNSEADSLTELNTNPDETDLGDSIQDASATIKALNKLDTNDGEKKIKKNNRLPLSVRRKKMNQRLSKILSPKSAAILLHEIKPGCTYRVVEQPGVNPPVFIAQVELSGQCLAMGQGMSKSHAKNIAAENAIKAIVSKTLAKSQSQGNEDENMDESVSEDSAENLPWAGLASFAMYKMFTEWQNQGTDMPIALPTQKKVVKPPAKLPVPKKELPPNAAELHPAVLLNNMLPGLIATEIERENGPKCSVKMGYTIDGQTYMGVGCNKKDAKKEAAKAVLTNLYGLKYT